MHSTTLSSKYQMVIPKAIREELDIKAGQTFLLIPKGNTLQLVPKLSLQDIKGIMPGANTKNYRDRSDRI